MTIQLNTVRVLSIDGGGIRGLIPATILAALQKMIGDTPLVDLFDVVTGTSTGGLIALGLTMPGPNGKPLYTADDMVRLYTDDASRIFGRSFWYRLRSLGGLCKPKYPATGIESVLREKYGSVQLKDALKEVVITSYDIQNRQVRLFSRGAARADPNNNFMIRDVARATSAAPTYFPPAPIMDLGDGSGMVMVDGGVGANNPTLVSYVEAMRMFPGKDFLIVTLGTGKSANPFPVEAALKWGVLGWAEPITDALFDAQASLVAEEMEMLLPPRPDGQLRRFRFQPSLDGASEKMDDVSPANLAALQQAAKDHVAGRQDDMQQIRDILLSSK